MSQPEAFPSGSPKTRTRAPQPTFYLTGTPHWDEDPCSFQHDRPARVLGTMQGEGGLKVSSFPDPELLGLSSRPVTCPQPQVRPGSQGEEGGASIASLCCPSAFPHARGVLWSPHDSPPGPPPTEATVRIHVLDRSFIQHCPAAPAQVPSVCSWWKPSLGNRHLGQSHQQASPPGQSSNLEKTGRAFLGSPGPGSPVQQHQPG